jgi:hypothetical protein
VAVFFSPGGNPEIWDEKPEGYFTPSEWWTAHPPVIPEPDPEAERLARIAEIDAELGRLDAKYLTFRVLAGIALADQYALDRYEKHEAEAEPLRLERAALLR